MSHCDHKFVGGDSCAKCGWKPNAMDRMLPDIVDILRNQRGSANAITARDISIALAKRGLATSERGVREIISEAETTEQMPLLLGGRGGEGFYVVETYDEIAERAMSLFEQIQSLTRRLQSYLGAASAAGIHVDLDEVSNPLGIVPRTEAQRAELGLTSRGLPRKKEAA